MKTISRYLMTLALLLTAATSAWAQEADYIIHVQFYNNYNPDQTPFYCDIMNMTDPEAEIKGTLELSVDGDLKGSFPVNGDMFMGNIDPVDAGNHTWSAVFKPEGGGEFSRDGHFTINKATPTIFNESSTSINLGVGESTEVEVYVAPDGAGELSYSSSDASVASITKKENSDKTYIIEAKATGTATITFSCAGNTNYNAAQDVKITVTVSTPPIDVTINDDKTEASFLMPTNDVTVNYELVRDMSVQMTATMGDGTDGLRYRVKKSEQNPGKYEPADMDMMQVLTLVAVNDGIEQKDLTLNQDYFCRIYKLDEQTQQPDGDGVELADFDFAPGLYALKAFAMDGSNYDGETALSNTFKLFEGYELKIAAGEYATYYKDEALYVEDEDAKLYTITTVGNETATATELTVAAANTPLLVKNNGSETKTILLIPTTTDTPDNVTPYEGFTGTLEAATIAASTSTQNNYAFNGKEFVWVKTALSVAANKAWLSISGPSNTRSISIVFDSETTGIDGVSSTVETGDGNWYDLNGRKFTTKPTKKGVYIMNGKKVVIKN